jgi:hypothetical protein
VILTRLAFAAGLALAAVPALAATLIVGPGLPYTQPSQAIEKANAGDTVEILPGDYLDCAFVRKDDVTIEGKGEAKDVIMSDKTCGGKALLVIDGNNDTIRNMTLARAAVPDRNGAGIRAEGGNLLIDGVRFINSENGILSADNPNATITIRNSLFDGNGACYGACDHAAYIGSIKLLDIEHSVFRKTHEGHHIKSRAASTIVVDSTIEDGPTGDSSYLIDIPNGGGLLIQGNTLEKGPKAENHSAAIIIGEEGVTHLSPQFIIKDNTFINDMPYPTNFVNNITRGEAILTGNKFKGTQITPLEGLGEVH